VRQLPEALKVASILVHRDVDDAVENGKNLVVRLLPRLVFEVLIPEGVGEEVQADVRSGALE
jgi:hypothetical protein